MSVVTLIFNKYLSISKDLSSELQKMQVCPVLFSVISSLKNSRVILTGSPWVLVKSKLLGSSNPIEFGIG